MNRARKKPSQSSRRGSVRTRHVAWASSNPCPGWPRPVHAGNAVSRRQPKAATPGEARAAATTHSFSSECMLHVEYTNRSAFGHFIAWRSAASWKRANDAMRCISVAARPPCWAAAAADGRSASPRVSAVPDPLHDGSSSTASALRSGSARGSKDRKSARHAVTTLAAPASWTAVRRRCSLVGSASKAYTLPIPRMSAATCVVLFPGAAHASTTRHPGRGASAWAAMHEPRV